MTEENLERFEQNAAQSRADLADTVDELRSRVSDTAEDLRHRASATSLKEEVKDYVDRTRKGMLQNIKRKANENPLGAVAVGAGMAFLGWRILRSIPAPLLLLGGGVALLRSGEQTHFTPPSASGSEHEREEGRPGGERELGTGSSPESLTGRLGGAAAAAGSAASRTVSGAGSAVSDAVSSVYRGGADATAFARDQVSQATQSTHDTFLDALDRYPLIAGGIGVAIGGLIAASLPVTQAEQRLLGETSEDLNERASRAIAQGSQAAEAAGKRVLKQVLGESAEQEQTSENAGRAT
jgi:hypothetical protein